MKILGIFIAAAAILFPWFVHWPNYIEWTLCAFLGIIAGVLIR